MKKIFLSTVLLGVSLFAEFKTIDATTLEKLQSKGTPVIDIRTPMEWKMTGIIKGSHKVTFFDDKGQPLLADWFFALGHIIKDKKEALIIYCAHANRSKSLGQGLSQMGFENVYELKGGIENGWMKKGKKTVK